MRKQPLLSETTEDAVKRLGDRLKAVRIERGDSQRQFAARLGVSLPTLGAMERGDPSTRLGYWLEALNLLGRLDEIDGLLAASTSLFSAPQQRQRVRSKR